ncbi:hypothetical protein IGI04_000888 [Brassica rapa subsp. trilocularis]|uniref:Uncharacterized protein n=1 Tax=Brassica rapa subsp. trilocularis TaxID=1813537 RepID=A0ABQ7NS38_BRACM|nr:hypothetical protein IGI04_000888 [Brassica rapa subsp. trilocularis]
MYFVSQLIKPNSQTNPETALTVRVISPLRLKSSSLFLSGVSLCFAILFLFPNSSSITPPMRVMVLQCALINPPFMIPTDLPHTLSVSMISRSLFIPLSQIVKPIPVPQILKSKPSDVN